MKNILYIADPNSIHDHKWITFFSNNKNNVFLVYEKQNNIYLKNTKFLKKNNVKILKPISSFSILYLISTIKSIYDLKKIIRKHQIDFVHILFATPHSFWGLFIEKPYIITTRGSDVLKVIPSLKEKTGLKSIYYSFLYKLIKSSFKKAKNVTSTSISQIESIEKIFGIKSQLIRTGIDIEGVINSRNKDKLPDYLNSNKFIFSPRFFSPIYNIKIQVDAIKKLPIYIIKEYTFVFIRGEKYDEKYANEIEFVLKKLKNTISLKFIIIDYLEQEMLWTFVNFASLTIHTPFSDGTPNSALESMAAKCPLILPNLFYDKDIFEDACLFLQKNDSNILARLIEYSLLKYPDKYLTNGFKNVSLFGNRKIEMNKLEKIYISI